jgi:hypothetical protein
MMVAACAALSGELTRFVMRGDLTGLLYDVPVE